MLSPRREKKWSQINDQELKCLQNSKQNTRIYKMFFIILKDFHKSYSLTQMTVNVRPEYTTFIHVRTRGNCLP